MADHSPKLMALSIDGVPFGLMERLIESGDMPNMAALAAQCGLRQMRSVQPTVSCVAWASYMTGMNPGKHGIYGFIDRSEGDYGLSFPNGSVMAVENIWQILSRAGKKVFGMNVPSTYPPRQVNGILIGGFLSPNIEKVAYPAGVSSYLKSIDYRIDSDAQLARRDKKAMLGDLTKTLDTRTEAMFHFLDADRWDFFHTHIMGTDRINHFLWAKMEDGDPELAPGFFDYYRQIDRAIGRLLERLDDDTALLIFSDHGFCRIEQEVHLSRYLVETGWTTPAAKLEHPLSIDPARSRAYCLIPGRLFINLAGREPAGIVQPQEYDAVRRELTEQLLSLKDTATGRAVIRKVLTKEQLYWPSGSAGPQLTDPLDVARAGGVYGRAADLIAVPYDGYDLKLGLASDKIFVRTELEGMHTYHDACILTRGIELPTDDLEIMMLARPILQKLGIEAPEDTDGCGSAVTPNLD